MESCLLILAGERTRGERTTTSVTSRPRCLGSDESRREGRQVNPRGLLMRACVALDNATFFRGIGGREEEALGVGGWGEEKKKKSQAAIASPVTARGYWKTLL